MEPVTSTVTIIFQIITVVNLIKELHDFVKEVKSFKEQSKTLDKNFKLLVQPLEVLQNRCTDEELESYRRRPIIRDTPAEEAGRGDAAAADSKVDDIIDKEHIWISSLFELEHCMEDVKTFLKKLSNKGWFKKSRQKNEIRQKFNSLNNRLEDLIRSLMLSLLIDFRRYFSEDMVNEWNANFSGLQNLVENIGKFAAQYMTGKELFMKGKEVIFTAGDLVAITVDRKTWESMKHMDQWSPEMDNLYGKIAMVTGVNSKGNVEVIYPERIEQHFTFHPDVLNKVPRLGKGECVRINEDLTFVKYLQETSQNGWVDGMEKYLGKEEKVMNNVSLYNSQLQLRGLEKEWSWHPCCLTRVFKMYMSDTVSDSSFIRELNEANNSFDSDSSDSSEGDEGSQLIEAVKRGDVVRVVEILSTSSEKANAQIGGKTALHMAAALGHLEVVQALLESGAEIDITDDNGYTPLHYSVEGDEPAITKYLIGKGADINRGNDNGRRAIHRAAVRGFVDCARVLINHGCDVNVQDTEKDTPLHNAITKSGVDVIELLVKVPDLDVTVPNKKGFTALQFAAFMDRPEPAELIAQSCPRSITAADNGYTILHIGAVNNNVEVMEAVMSVKDHGLDVNAKNVQGMTALHLAAHRGGSHSMEFLMSQGADINLHDEHDHTALHLLANTAAKDPSDIKYTPTLRKIRKRFRGCGVDNIAAAALCYMVLNGASIDLLNAECRTPLYHIRNAELKKTLKKIACEKISWEDLGEVEDIIIKQNDGLSGTDKDSPKRIGQDSAESESGADSPAGNQQKIDKPEIEGGLCNNSSLHL